MRRLALLLAMALVVVAPASARAALNVTLTATPTSAAVVGSAVRLAAVATPTPNNTAAVMFKFSVARDPGGEPVAGRNFDGLPTWTWTPSAAGTYMFVVTVEARDSANRVLATGSASIRNYSVSVGLLAPGIAVQLGQILLANPYSLEVYPSSFAATSGRLPGGIVPHSQTQRPTGGAHATTDTLIKLTPSVKPGQTEAPIAQRHCVFEAVAADGGRAFTKSNHCEQVETRLPQGTFTLRLGYGSGNTPPANFSFVEVRNYLVYPVSQFAPVVPAQSSFQCIAPCAFTSGVCTWPASSGGLAFSCGGNQDCASGNACVSGKCVPVCPSGVPCSTNCEFFGGTCTEPPSIFRVNRFCASARDCDGIPSGYQCIAGECRRSCPR